MNRTPPRLLCAFTLFLLSFSHAWAQGRYYDEVFEAVEVVEDVVYGNNFSILSGFPEFQDLMMDVYMPANDTESLRPLVIVIPEGNFQPRILNFRPFGTRRDSLNVALCTQLARRGFVAASISHRLGWATSGTLEGIRASYVQALYRAMQDAHTCVRYVRRQAVEEGNPLGIDTENIAMGGMGSGGMVALSAAYLDQAQELQLDKLSFEDGRPYVDPGILGDFFARDTAVLCRPNHPNYDSEVDLVFSLGGAVVDTSWLAAGDVPAISFHVPIDPVIPYESGFVRRPITNEVLLEVHGAKAVSRKAQRLGNQDSLFTAGIFDPYTLAVNARNEGIEGLVPFPRPRPATGAVFACEIDASTTLPRRAEHNPWSWWDEAQFVEDWTEQLGNTPISGPVANCNERAGNPEMSPEQGRAYADTVAAYLAPRFLRMFGLITSRPPSPLSAGQLHLFPNPTQGVVHVSLPQQMPAVQAVTWRDLRGRVLHRQPVAGLHELNLERPPQLPAGMYLLEVQLMNHTSIHRRIELR